MLRLDPGQNTTVTPDHEQQSHNALVDVVGTPGVQLDRRAVLFLVPPKDPGVP